MTSKLTITLRDRTYTAENPTRHEAQILASLFLPGESEQERIESLQQAIDTPALFDFDLDDPAQQSKYAAVISVRLQSPSTKARIASTLKSLFPGLPDSLVDYHLLEHKGKPEHDYTWKLEDEEVLEIIRAVLENLNQPQPEQPKGFTKSSQGRKRKVAQS